MAIRLERRGRNWAVYDGETLVCLTVYKKGAAEVVRRLTAICACNSQLIQRKEKAVCPAQALSKTAVRRSN
jgi:hypothetical protein